MNLEQTVEAFIRYEEKYNGGYSPERLSNYLDVLEETINKETSTTELQTTLRSARV